MGVSQSFIYRMIWVGVNVVFGSVVLSSDGLA
jgi:hypothetical protein